MLKANKTVEVNTNNLWWISGFLFMERGGAEYVKEREGVIVLTLDLKNMIQSTEKC